jgi:hypothetical protein
MAYRFISGLATSPLTGGFESLGLLELTALPSIKRALGRGCRGD